MARRAGRKKTRFAENPPSRIHHWPVPLPKDWQIIPLDYPRRRRSQRFAHCAFTVRSRITRRTRISSATNVQSAHTSENWPIKRLFFPRLARTHTRASFRPFLIDATRDGETRNNRVKRKRKLRLRPPGTRAPPRSSRACAWIRMDSRRHVAGFLNFFFSLRKLFWKSVWMTQERDNLLYTQLFFFYIYNRKTKIEIYPLEYALLFIEDIYS